MCSCEIVPRGAKRRLRRPDCRQRWQQRSSRRQRRRAASFAALVAVTLACGDVKASEFDASVAPDGRFLLKLYPKIYYTAAYFSDRGRAQNLTEVTGLLYAEIPVQLQYGITGALSVGTILPIGWAYREAGPQSTVTDRIALREAWVTLQHRWLPLGIVSSSALRVKIPITRKADFEDGLRIGDDQWDIYPAYHFDYYSKTHYWFTELAVGYRYRFESNSGIKPFDETRFSAEAGYELLPEHRVRLFLQTDLTWFLNGDFGVETPQFFQHTGSLHNFGYGMSLWPRPTFRLEIATSGDWSGRNQFRGMLWTIGITKIL